MQSFYGGRQGASFEIKKRFDGINIPQSGTKKYYKRKYLARVSAQGDDTLKIGEGIILLDDNGNFIERSVYNVNDYTWGIYELNGESRQMKRGSGSTITKAMPIEYAEGMIQFFEKGASTLSEVNYGDYVIIDTIDCGLDVDSIDNGKIFRRGLDNTPEYICHISAIAFTTKKETEWQNIISKPDNIVYDSNYFDKVTKLNTIEEGAQVHKQANWNATDITGVLNKPTKLSEFSNDIASLSDGLINISKDGSTVYSVYSKAKEDALLNEKVSKENGMGLSHNDLTDDYVEIIESATSINDEEKSSTTTYSSSKIEDTFSKIKILTQDEYDDLGDNIDESVVYLIKEEE